MSDGIAIHYVVQPQEKTHSNARLDKSKEAEFSWQKEQQGSDPGISDHLYDLSHAPDAGSQCNFSVPLASLLMVLQSRGSELFSAKLAFH